MPRRSSGPQTPHVTVSRSAKPVPAVDLEAAFSAVAPKVRKAAELAAEELRRRKIPHVLVGGLAVGAHGYPRATKDVDYLVGDEAFEHHGGFVTLKVPFEVNGVPLDSVSVPKEAPFLKDELKQPKKSDEIPVVSLPGLVLMKLIAGRQRDRSDLVELVKAGIDVEAVRAYLLAHARERVPAFDRIVEIAREEE